MPRNLNAVNYRIPKTLINCFTLFALFAQDTGLKEEENFLGNTVISRYSKPNSLRRLVADKIGVDLERFLPSWSTERHLDNLTFKQVRDEVLFQLKFKTLLSNFNKKKITDFGEISDDLIRDNNRLIYDCCPRKIRNGG
jgi:hypothetical protein